MVIALSPPAQAQCRGRPWVCPAEYNRIRWERILASDTVRLGVLVVAPEYEEVGKKLLQTLLRTEMTSRLRLETNAVAGEQRLKF